jgi:hypothetical protein
MKNAIDSFYKDWSPDSFCKYDIASDPRYFSGFSMIGSWGFLIVGSLTMLLSSPILSAITIASCIAIAGAITEPVLFYLACSRAKKLKLRQIVAH